MLARANILHMRTLCCLAREGSYTRAAATLGYSVSAVSLHISRLEADLGCDLLLRTSNGYVLTAAGRMVAESTEAIVAELERLSTSLIKHSQPVKQSQLLGHP